METRNAEFLQAVEDYRNVADPSVKKRKMLYVLLKVY
jgi:hypothetical protein